ncbi:MAG TPA: WD40 repeat domain-containing protein, partial [Gemmatimonadaceae bacterium]|nr:WD40 repeat domain-containing protein [Gemmatimonadaceae bacterium]
ERPRGRLVLGFRKEWLSEVKAALEAHRVARTEHRLEQLTRGGVLEAITGPTRVPARRMQARLEIEPGLDVLIADDLLANRASHVAPLLQILLATMWSDAPRSADVVRFDAALYAAVQAKSKQLAEFLDQQLAALRAWHAPVVESGLALEFLRFYTTPKGSSDEHTIDEERQRYPNADTPTPGLRAMCARLFLLVERVDDAGAPPPGRPARLAHDTLAPIVRERFDRSDLPGPRAKRILDGRSAEWKDGHVGTPLDAEDLGVVEAGEAGMRVWNDEEKTLVAASRVARDRARRRRAWVIRGAIAAVVLIAGFGVGSWVLYRQSQTRLAESTSREWSARALTTDEALHDVGLLYAVASYEKTPTFEAKRAVFTQLGREPSLIRVASTRADGIEFSADGRRLLLRAADGIGALDLASGQESVVRKFPPGTDIATLVIDPGGTTYSVTSVDSTTDVVTLRIRDVATGKAISEIRVSSPNKPVDDSEDPTAFNWQVGPPGSDGRRLVAGSQGHDVVLWDATTGAERRRLRGHTSPAVSIAFSADGSVLATSDGNTHVIAWDVSTGQAIRRITSDAKDDAQLVISRDNSTLAIAQPLANEALALWPLRTNGRPRYLPVPHAVRVAFLARNAGLVAASNDGEVYVFGDPMADEPDQPLVLHATDIPDAFAVSDTGFRIAVMSGEGLVHAWDLQDSGLMRATVIGIDSTASVVAMSADGRQVAATSMRGTAIWDIGGDSAARRFDYSGVDSKSFPPARHMEIGAAGRLVLIPMPVPDSIWRYALNGSPDTVQRILGQARDHDLAADPVRPRVAYGVPNRRAVVVADLASGTFDTLDLGRARNAPVDAVLPPTAKFSPRGDRLLVQPSPDAIYVWDLATRRVVDSLTGANIYSQLESSADGGVVAALDGLMVKFWRGGSPKPTSFYRWKPGAPPNAFALSPDGAMFAYDQSGKIMLGDVTRGDIIGEVDTENGNAVALAFAGDGRTVVAVSRAGSMVRVVTDPEAWIARACAIVRSREAHDRFTANGPAGAQLPRRCETVPATR